MGRYVTIARVSSVGGANGWFYIACKDCKKKVFPYPEESGDTEQSLWKCTTCKKDVSGVIAW